MSTAALRPFKAPALPVAYSDAVLSPCGAYRYMLWRTWDLDAPYAIFAMLNPSKADARVDDPTARKCVGFARRWGCGGVVLVNIYAFRATDPAVLRAARRSGVDVVGPDNMKTLYRVFSAALASGGQVVAAWGAVRPGESAAARGLLHGLCVPVKRIGPPLAGGHPRHPLMPSYAVPLEPHDLQAEE